MNAYVVKTKNEREYVEPITDEGQGPTVPYWPMEPVVAETPARAKRFFLDKYARAPLSGVYSDDWPNLRVRLLLKNVGDTPGVYDHHGDSREAEFWHRIHELEDHRGATCDCQEEAAA